LAPPPVAPRESRPAQPNGAAGAQGGDTDEFTTVGKGGKSVQHTSDTIFKDLAQVNENRGKKVSPLPLHVHLLTFGVEYGQSRASPHFGKTIGLSSHHISTNPGTTRSDLFAIRL